MNRAIYSTARDSYKPFIDTETYRNLSLVIATVLLIVPFGDSTNRCKIGMDDTTRWLIIIRVGEAAAEEIGHLARATIIFIVRVRETGSEL